MNGVKFNNLHSYNDYSLILVDAVIDAPEPKTELINIPGADGVLDFSEYFGEINYKNRSLSFDFEMKADISNFMNLFSIVQNALHGKVMQVALDVDNGFYYVGRVTIDKWLADRRIGKISICYFSDYPEGINPYFKRIGGRVWAIGYNQYQQAGIILYTHDSRQLEWYNGDDCNGRHRRLHMDCADGVYLTHTQRRIDLWDNLS